MTKLPVRDPISTTARWTLKLGLFSSSFLVFRVSSYTYGDILLVLSALITLAIGPNSVRRIDRYTWVAVWMILVGGLLSTLRADSAGASVLVVARLVYLVAVLPWQMRRVLTTHRQLLSAGAWWAAGTAGCAFGAIYQAQGGIISGTASITNAGRYTGFTGHVSDLGGVAAVGATFFLAGAFSRHRKAFLPWLIGGAVCLYGLILAGSVSGMLALGVVVLFMIFRRNFRPFRLALSLVGVIAAFELATAFQTGTKNALSPAARISQVLGRSSAVPGQQGLDTSAERITTDEFGLMEWVRHPIFGRGLDSQSTVIPSLNLEVHNFFIGALYGGGFFLFVGLVMPVLRSVRAVLLMPRSDEYGGQLANTCAATLVFSLTAPSVFNRYFWIPVALLAVYQSRSCRSPAVSRERAPSAKLTSRSQVDARSVQRYPRR